MRSLYESLLDDFDTLAKDQDDYGAIYEFAEALKSNNTWCANKISLNKITNEINIADKANVYVHINIPEYIKFNAPLAAVTVENAVEDMKSLENVGTLIFSGDSVKVEKMGKVTAKDIRVETGFFKDFKWLPDELDEFTIASSYKYPNLDLTSIDLLNKDIKDVYIRNCHKITEIKNVNCRYLEVSECDKLTTIENCTVTGQTTHWSSVYIAACKNLKEFKGKNSFEQITVDATPKKLDPTTLPKDIKSIRGANHLGQVWLWDNISTTLPNLDFDRCSLPSISKFKALNDADYKKGAWVVVRGKHKSSGAWGSTRGELCVDRIKNINKQTGGITTENCGSKTSMDFELMRDVNKNKDWSYVDPNGINDITGVGIEVGDEVVVYCASGSFGKNRGIELDVITTIHKNRVGCKKNMLRRPQDICILRSQKLCDEQFK